MGQLRPHRRPVDRGPGLAGLYFGERQLSAYRPGTERGDGAGFGVSLIITAMVGRFFDRPVVLRLPLPSFVSYCTAGFQIALIIQSVPADLIDEMPFSRGKGRICQTGNHIALLIPTTIKMRPQAILLWRREGRNNDSSHQDHHPHSHGSGRCSQSCFAVA